jgi:hypothetical protein
MPDPGDQKSTGSLIWIRNTRLQHIPNVFAKHIQMNGELVIEVVYADVLLKIYSNMNIE